MERASYDGICAYMGGVWGRELSNVARAAGWKLLHALPDSAVEKAVDAIATDGREHLPPWPIVYKAASAIAQAERELLPALPASDVLTDVEHTGVMLQLRAKETLEQRRRADRMTKETRTLPMKVRLKLAKDLLTGDASQQPPATWDALFDEAVEAAEKVAQPLLAREVAP